MPDADHDRVVEILGEVRSLSHRMLAFERAEQERPERERRMFELLVRIHDDDVEMRRRLQAGRATPEWELAWTDPDPLVSVVIPTYVNRDLLVERALPSVLAQSHANLEVIVVGDAADASFAPAIADLGDERVRFENLTHRGPYEDGYLGWLTYGTLPYNRGVELARGRWIAPLGDDDAFEPEHVSALLARARRDRLEYVYGQTLAAYPDGHRVLGSFPPAHGDCALQSALLHAGLPFLPLETAHAYAGRPNDWGMIVRMLRCGVRIGMVEQVTSRYYPSRAGLAAPESEHAVDPAIDLHRQVERLRAQLDVLRDTELPAVRRRAEGLEAELVAIRGSRSWRAASAISRAGARARRGRASRR